MLPSQIARPSSSRSHMYRRTRSRRVPAILGAIAILGAGYFTVKWLLGSGDPSGAQAVDKSPAVLAPKTNANDNRVATLNGTQKPTNTETTRVSPPLPPPDSTPVEKITMGGAPSSPPPAVSTATMPASVAASTSEPAKPDLTPKTTPPPAEAPAKPNSTPLATPATSRIQAGLDLIAQNKPVEARAMLTAVLENPNLSAADGDRIRTELTKVNQRLVFGPEVVPNDPFTSAYVIESGDVLAKLTRKLNLKVDWRFLQRINNISSPERIRVGQRIKIVKGPFHAVIDKREYRMDLYMGDGSDRVYVRSIRVGLGEGGGTPEGEFIVKPNSKLVDPAWTNPRTGEHFASGDPKNPLGKYWIGLLGISDNIRDLETYGIHGTVDPDSIGQNRSMGCVRLGAEDIALTYELMIEGVSRVQIRGEDYP